MSFRLSLSCGIIVFLPLSTASGQEHTKARIRDDIVRILGHQDLWGKDFPQAVARLGAWSENGENKVAVFTYRIVGMNSYRDLDAADKVVIKVREAMTARRGERGPLLPELLRNATQEEPASFQVRVLSSFPDDRSIRVAWSASKGAAAAPEFLRRGLTLERVRTKIGGAEKISKQVLENARDKDRPNVLTLHEYAGGAIVFAESSLSPRSGTVDRVILNVAQIIETVRKSN
jgi:hypothetical protein